MQQIVILGGGAAGLAAALAAAQSAPAGAVRVTVLDRNPRCGKKLLATGNGRCNLDNTGIAPEQYFTADPAALRPLLAAVDAAAPLEWFAALGLYTRTDEAGRVYPYSNQAADVLALLEGHLARLGVEVRTGCTVQTLSQNRSGYTILCEDAEGRDQTLRADAVICAMGGNAGPQFGTDGFGTRFAAQCGGKLEPLYPCLTALQTAKPNRSLAGIRAKAAATLLDLDRHCTVAVENGEVQFTDYGLSGICIMQLSGHLAPGRGPKRPAVELDLFPMLDETALTALFAALTSILAKLGIDGVNSNLATAIRTVVVVVMAWGMVFLTHAQNGIFSLGRKSWIFLILSGLATGASWLCYYRALQLGDASKVVPVDKLSVVMTLILAFVFLHEDFTAKSLIGCILIGAGTLVMVL